MKQLLRPFLFCLTIAFSFALNNVAAQGGTWVWMNGTDSLGSRGNYGTMGVPAPTNYPAGTYQSVQWTDTAGNFWLYGGLSASGGELGALWKFDPLTNLWTWVSGSSTGDYVPVYGTKGVPAVGNTPGSRGFGTASWTDKNGDLWMFAGRSWEASGDFPVMADLWRYNIASNEWTWMAGPNTGYQPGVYGTLGQPAASNYPPCRNEINDCWIDKNNNFWLYGGYINSDTSGNDTWMFNTSNNEWTWMNGGPSTASTVPQSRDTYLHWADEQGNFYLSGGCKLATGTMFDDTWKFNPDSNSWTQLTPERPALFGAYCNEMSNINPGIRMENRSTQTSGCQPKMLAFGGATNAGLSPYFNDLWLFDPTTVQWKWVSGDSTNSPAGNYGTKGVLAPTNMPPGRAGHCFWADKAGNLWVWGGVGSGFISDPLNDLWKFIPDTSCLPVITGGTAFNYAVADFSICKGDSTTLTISSGSVLNVSPAVTWVDSTHAIVSPDSSTFYMVVGLGGCPVAYDTSGFTITIHRPQAAIAANDSVICSPDSAQLCATAGFSTYLWSTGQTTACIYSATQGNYQVTVTDSIHCSATSNQFLLTVHPSPTVSLASGDSIICPNDSAQICATPGLNSYVWNTGQTTSCIYTNQAGNYYVTVTNASNCSTVSGRYSLFVYQVPPVQISVVGDTLFSRNAVSYQWFNNGDSLRGATGQTYVATSAGSYTVQITDSNGCTGISNPYIISSINQFNEERISVYPNPSSTGKWQVDVSNTLLGSSWEIYDDEGRLVYASQIEKQHFEINTCLAAGVYFLAIESAQNRLVRRLVVE